MMKCKESLKSSFNFPRNIRESFYVFVFLSLIEFCNYFARRRTTSQIQRKMDFPTFLQNLGIYQRLETVQFTGFYKAVDLGK